LFLFTNEQCHGLLVVFFALLFHISFYFTKEAYCIHGKVVEMDELALLLLWVREQKEKGERLIPHVSIVDPI